MVHAVDLDAVRRQVEYYFSDSNLPRDKFLRAKTEENEDGYVDINVVISFKRMQMLNATVEDVVNALKNSTHLSIDTSATRVRRSTSLPEKSLFDTRAVFAKGWVAGGPEPKLEDIVALFSPSGRVLSVRYRRYGESNDRHFKGSIFVEMESPEAAERVVAEEYSIDVEVDGEAQKRILEMLPVGEYFDRKRKEYKLRTNKHKGPRDKKKGQRGGPKQELEHANRPFAGRTDRKADSSANASADQHPKVNGTMQVEAQASVDRKTTEAERTPLNGQAEPVPVPIDSKAEPMGIPVNGKAEPVPASVTGKVETVPGTVKGDDSVKNEPFKREFTPATVLRFQGCGPDVSREDIREVFDSHGVVTWVDFRRGDSEGHIRFSDNGEAAKAMEAVEKAGIAFGDKKPTYTLLEGEAEEAFWKQVWREKEERFNEKKRRRDNRVGHGGRHGKRFRRDGRGRGPRRGS